MIKLKHLFQLAGAGLALGMFCNPSPAKALTLSLGGTTITNNLQDNQAGDINSTSNIIDFRFTNQPVTDSSGNTATVSGFLRALWGSGALVDETGQQLGGVLLTLREYEVTAATTNTSSFNINDLILFSHDFTYSFSGRRGAPSQVTAYQQLTGEFRSNSTNNVASTNQVSFTALVNTSLIANQSSGTPEARTVSQINLPVASATLSNANSSLDNPTLQGNLTQLTLAPGQSVRLQNSACFAIVDLDSEESSFTADDVERNCKKAPEPSSMGAILAFSILGASSLLRRKGLSNQ
ncbi:MULTISPECIES: hypothetical protein [unclassified Coleofasciculus]|uniref:hypothetical protein n=1 Tax=unclassified Coleofasciculus TaxID=2692782 RepID=UPI00187F6E0A|nr:MULTISPECIES: hypothetical protein [unclassified Coleofasciculus]MBE9127122.1 hypothetical protein [Coleofasciculus sp. LEGE 07081]MBE9149771.1 hypothetical protein [Coleofasciculus sp. LEGE 07092]